jgi:hypothetical protein
MIGPWHGIGPQPQHHVTAVPCGTPACAPWANQGCAAGYPAERTAPCATKTQECRECGKQFPYSEDADRCSVCVAAPHGERLQAATGEVDGGDDGAA